MSLLGIFCIVIFITALVLTIASMMGKPGPLVQIAVLCILLLIAVYEAGIAPRH